MNTTHVVIHAERRLVMAWWHSGKRFDLSIGRSALCLCSLSLVLFLLCFSFLFTLESACISLDVTLLNKSIVLYCNE